MSARTPQQRKDLRAWARVALDSIALRTVLSLLDELDAKDAEIERLRSTERDAAVLTEKEERQRKHKPMCR